jgi:hypothetical protein
LTKDAAMALIHEVESSRRETKRYRDAVAQLRAVIDAVVDAVESDLT